MLLEDLQPEIIVLIGLPGSGKSTWTEKMLSQTDTEYVIVSSDAEIEKLAAADNLSYDQAFDKYVGKATGIMKQKFKDAVNKGKNIIWDQTNMNPKKRRGILNQVPDNYRKIAVAFEIDDEELQRRLDHRSRTTGKTIPDHVMKSMAKSYVPPSKQEGFDEVYIM